MHEFSRLVEKTDKIAPRRELPRDSYLSAARCWLSAPDLFAFIINHFRAQATLIWCIRQREVGFPGFPHLLHGPTHGSEIQRRERRHVPTGVQIKNCCQDDRRESNRPYQLWPDRSCTAGSAAIAWRMAMAKSSSSSSLS